jgi:hypothetical protein
MARSRIFCAQNGRVSKTLVPQDARAKEAAMLAIPHIPPSRPVFRKPLWPAFLLLLAVIACTWASQANSQPLQGGVSQDVFSSNGSAGSAGRGTYPTGSQSHQPNDAPCSNPYGCGRGGPLSGGANAAPYPQGRDVYCQQSPGQPMYGPYHGTGTQTPCGPNFQPMSTRPQQQPTATSCSNVSGELDQADRPGPLIRPVGFLRFAHDDTAQAAIFRPDGTAASAFIQRVQAGQTSTGLVIGGKTINPNSDQDYNCTIKYLTVPYNSQNSALFLSTNTASIKARLEDPLRRQIFDAMTGNPKPFRFKTITTTNENIDIRVKTIQFMRSIQNGTGSCRFTPATPFILSTLWTGDKPPTGWTAPHGVVLNSATSPGAAHAAIYEFTHALISGLDCLGGVELTILVGVDSVIGGSRFNKEHPEGIQNIGLNVSITPPVDTAAEDEPTSTGAWNNISIFKNVKVFSSSKTFQLTPNLMVPGDWVYMRNDPRYAQIAPSGAWTGENTIYMGKYKPGNSSNNPIYLKPSDPSYTGDADARFSGLGGEFDKSAPELAGDLGTAFTAADPTHRPAAQIGWTVLGRIKAGDSGASSPNPPIPPSAMSGPVGTIDPARLLRNLFGQ